MDNEYTLMQQPFVTKDFQITHTDASLLDYASHSFSIGATAVVEWEDSSIQSLGRVIASSSPTLAVSSSLLNDQT